MKHQLNQHRQMIVIATIATVFSFATLTPSSAEKGIGAKYGTRDPRICADTKALKTGPMTAALATKYLISSMEGVKGDYLYLVEGLTTVEVGGAVPYNPKRFPYATDIDVTAPVYPIRFGSYKEYQCEAVTENNKGYNATMYPYEKGTGVCVKTTFGDWTCTADYQSVDRSKVENGVPPPAGAKAAAAEKPNAAAKNDNQTDDNQGGAGEDKDKGGLPKPDLTEMEKYYDISKVEYNTADRKLYFIGKMTKKNNAVDWSINFYDADGIKVYTQRYVNPESGDYSEVGDVAKFAFYLPAESKWKYVTKVVVTRLIP